MQNKSQKRHCRFRVRVGPSVRKIINSLFACNIDSIANHYTRTANTFLVNNGPEWTVKRLKGYYGIGCKIALELDADIIPFCRTKGDVPRDMLPYLSFLRSPDIKHRRACLTVLRLYTQIYGQVSKDTESITASGPTELTFEKDFKENFDKILDKYMVITKPYLRDEGIFTSAKAGPNGHAMLRCDEDFYAIKESGILETIKLLNSEIELSCKDNIEPKREVNLHQDFCPDFDGTPEDDMVSTRPRSVRKQQMYDCMENFIQWRDKADPKAYTNVKHSKLSFLAEGGCKTRVVAIGDYFTQDCLKPIHKSLYRVLSKLKTDGTSSHNRIAQVVKDKTSERCVVRSFDLTNATDRFPVFLQEQVLCKMYGPKISKLWKELMVNRKFFVDEKRSVSYGQGQPMGLLSSWAAFAVTHHVIVETCAMNVGINTFTDYVVIGDDVTIFNSKVANEYVRFLELFDIEISKAKSLESGGNPSSAEIAKRLFINGSEISPIPYDALESSVKNYLLFPNLARLCVERDVTIDIANQAPVQSALEAIYKSKTAKKVLTLLSFPLQSLPFGITSDLWDETDSMEIETVFNELQLEHITSKAKSLYENELMNIPDMGTLGQALESGDGPEGLSFHPLFVLLRAYRDRCGSIHQGLTIRSLDSKDWSLIPFLINPMIPNFVRRSHMIEKVRSTIILKVYKKLMEKQAIVS